MMTFYKSGFKAMFAVVLMCSFLAANAQTRVIEIAPTLGSINNVIDGDTLDNGDRIEPLNTVYQLQGGQLYPMIRSLINVGYPLHIRTNPDDTQRARLQPFAVGGGESARTFEAQGDLRLEGIRVTNQDNLGTVIDRTIRLRAEGIRLTIDNCWIEVDAQAAIRMDETNSRIFVTNSIFSNVGLANDPDNGRFIDDRGNTLDSLLLENTLIYNITSRILRDGGNEVNWARVNQNTFHNIGQRGFEFNQAREVFFTNNMIVNGVLRGTDEGDEQPFVEIEAWEGDGEQVFVVSNNNIYTDPSVTAIYPDLVVGPVLLDSTGIATLNDEIALASNTTEAITFNNPSAVPTQWVTDFFNDNIPNTPSSWDPSLGTYNYFYAITFASYTGGTSSQPIGILPPGFMVSVRDLRANFDFDVFPNPTSNQLHFRIPEGVDARIAKLFSIVGAEVASYKLSTNGLQTVDLTQVPAGVYILSIVQADGKMSAKRVIKN